MIEEEVYKIDWTRVQSFADSSESLPNDICDLVSAGSVLDAEMFHDRIERTVLMDGTLSEACLAVAACLVSAIAGMSSSGRTAALDLLAQIGSANVYGPAAEQIGNIDVELCRRIVAQGFESYVAELGNSSSFEAKLSCIDLVTISGHVDPSLKLPAITALESARTQPNLVAATKLIDASLADLRFGANHGGMIE